MFFLSRVNLLVLIAVALLYGGLIWFLYRSIVRLAGIERPGARRALLGR